MNNKMLTIFLIATLVILSIYVFAHRIPYDSNTMNYNITPTQAIQAAKDWIGNQNLQLEVTLVDQPDAGQEYTPRYIIKTIDRTQTFFVDTSDGSIISWKNNLLAGIFSDKCQNKEDISKKLPASEISAARDAYLLNKYPGFIQYNMKPVDMSGARYAQLLPNGAYNFFRQVTCGVDEWTGEIYSYYAPKASDSPISTQYSIQKNQAEQNALSHINEIDWCLESPEYQGDTGQFARFAKSFVYGDSEVYVSKNNGTPKLVWSIRVISHLTNPAFDLASYREDIKNYYLDTSELPSIDSNIVCWNVEVDANTGSIKSCENDSTDYFDPLPVAAPTFSPDGGSYTGTQTVTMSCSEPGSTIRYTTDGSKPTPTSTLYTTPISVNSNITIKARAFKANLRSSEVKSAAYVIQ